MRSFAFEFSKLPKKGKVFIFVCTLFCVPYLKAREDMMFKNSRMKKEDVVHQHLFWSCEKCFHIRQGGVIAVSTSKWISNA